jgi:TonB family protein
MLNACASASTSPVTSAKFRQAEAPIVTLHHAEFDRTAQTCELVQAPEALATPDPLLNTADPDSRVAVSFVIGIDGRVHSPVILESAGSSEDESVLQALRLWRYRPATCNAAPTEMESKVEFSSR